MNPPRQSRPERFDQILDAAADLLRDQSIESTTFAEIAGRIGVKQQALYYYVASRDELFYQLLAREMDRALDMLRAKAASTSTDERLRELFREHVKVIADRPALFQFFFGQLSSLRPEFQADLRQREREYTEIFRAATADAIDAGVLPPVDLRIASDALIGMATWTYQWLRDKDKANLDRVVNQMLELVAFQQGEA